MLPAWEAWAVSVGIPAFVGVISWISHEAQNWKGMKNFSISDVSDLVKRVQSLESAYVQLPKK